MKKWHLIMLSYLLILNLIGCSAKEKHFKDGNIIFNVTNIEADSGHMFYTIEISNKTGFDLTHLTFNLSYPIKEENGSKSNPFVVEAKTESGIRPVNLSSEEKLLFYISAPIKDVFGDSKLLDFENPNVQLKGYYIKEGKEEIPFYMGGGLRVFDQDY